MRDLEVVGFDHINRNPPVLIRTPKLTRFEPAQYWGGGPPGNSVVLNPFLSNFAVGCHSPESIKNSLVFTYEIINQKVIRSRFVRVILAQGPC